MAGIKIVDLPALGRDLISTDLLEVSLNGSGSRKITGQEIMNASKLAVGSTPIVSGTVGRLLFQGTGNVLGQNSFLFWDNSNTRLGVGTNTPLYTLDVAGNIHGSTIFSDYNIVTTAGNVWLSDGYAIGDYGTGNNRIEFYNNRISLFGNGNEAMRIVGSTQNVLIGTTTDSGFKLNVNGTARVQGSLSLTAGNVINIGNVQALAPNTGNDLMVGFNNSLLTFYTGNNPVGRFFSTGNFAIGTTSDNGFRLDVNGTARVQDDLTVSRNKNQTTGVFISNTTNSASSAVAINLTSSNGEAVFAKKPALGSVYKTILGNDTYIYNGTAGDISMLNDFATGRIKFAAGGASTAQMTLFSTGNFAINTTTDAGFRLDVNGTARVTGAMTIGNSVITGNFGNLTLSNSGVAGVALTFTNNSWGSSDVAVFGTQGTHAHASSQIEIRSTTRGFLPPRMTNAQRAAIASPAVGLIVYCTDSTEGLYVYKSTGWTFMV